MILNKKGVTILELLISITLVGVVVLLLLRLTISLGNINNDTTYASSDEINRTTIIKNIETELLKRKLKGLEIITVNELKIKWMMEDNTEETLIVREKELEFKGEVYPLESKEATYQLCPSYSYTLIDNDYYEVNITIPVLIKGVNTTEKDDIVIDYLALIKEGNNYPDSYVCTK